MLLYKEVFYHICFTFHQSDASETPEQKKHVYIIYKHMYISHFEYVIGERQNSHTNVLYSLRRFD